MLHLLQLQLHGHLFPQAGDAEARARALLRGPSPARGHGAPAVLAPAMTACCDDGPGCCPGCCSGCCPGCCDAEAAGRADRRALDDDRRGRVTSGGAMAPWQGPTGSFATLLAPGA